MKIRKSELEGILVEEAVREITSAMGGDDMGGPLSHERFTGGSIDIDPLSGEEQESSSDAYYELRQFLMDGPGQAIPGSKPSDKLRHALRWIAKFEGGTPSASNDNATGDPLRQFMRNAPGVSRSADGSRSLEEGVATHPDTGEQAVTAEPGDSEWPSDSEFGAARQDDLQTTMLKAAGEISQGRAQEAYETLLRALAAAGVEADGLEEDRSTGTGSSNAGYRGGSDAKEADKRKNNYRSGATGKKNQGRSGY